MSDNAIPDDDDSWIGRYPNSYAIPIVTYLNECLLAGETHHFELPEGAIEPSWKLNDINVHGCGLVLDSEDKLWIFFTLNGNLVGEFVQDILKIHK
jgi:hypothetical protein